MRCNTLQMMSAVIRITKTASKKTGYFFCYFAELAHSLHCINFNDLYWKHLANFNNLVVIRIVSHLPFGDIGIFDILVLIAEVFFLLNIKQQMLSMMQKPCQFFQLFVLCVWLFMKQSCWRSHGFWRTSHTLNKIG